MENQTVFSISEERYYDRSIPELQNKMICAYAHDWLVLFDYDSRDCYLWNANSEEKTQLPPLPEDGYVRCLLSGPPHDPECCRLFLIDESREDDIYLGRCTFYFCKPGYNERFHKQEMQLDDKLGDWTVFNGKFYALMFHESILLLLDVDNNLGTITITPMVDRPAFDYCRYPDMPLSGRYLIQSSCGGDHMLLCLHKLYYGCQLKLVYGFFLFQFDFKEKAWKKLTSIGENAVFLSDMWGITCSTRGANIEKDSIYFIERDDHRLHLFEW